MSGNIRDIAKMAGVSVSTVSKVMNGKDKDISDKTKKKVLEIIEREQYVPYFKYLEKEGLKSRFLGLILKKNNRERDQIVLSAEKAAKEREYQLVVSYAEDMDTIEKNVETMNRTKMAGFIIDSEKEITRRESDPVTIYLNNKQNFDEQEKTVFYYSMSEAGRMATEHLMKVGHERIACIVLEKDKDILDGYKVAMLHGNQRIQPVWIFEGKALDEIEKRGIIQCLSENVTAIVCGSQEIACCVSKVLGQMRISVPEDISLISIGDDRILDILSDGISAVKLPSDRMAEDAVHQLIDMIHGKKKNTVIRRYSSQLVERKSVRKPKIERQGEKIIVVGSMNVDIMIEVPKLPVNGESLLANKLYTFLGGKGGNQAVGVGKLGGQVYMIGCLGNDLEGKQLYAGLVENHVHTDGIVFSKQLASGRAYINVETGGESTIVAYPGANQGLQVSHIKQFKYLFQDAKYCLLSMEIPEEVVEYALSVCRRNHTKTILKPSSPHKLKNINFENIDYLVPNEKELCSICGYEGSIEERARRLLEKGVQNVIVTLGSNGCYLLNEAGGRHFKGSGFEAVDTTGGADSFISALAVYLSEGKSMEHAIRFAIYASGICVTGYGVQPALPDRRTVEVYEEEIFQK